MGWISLKIEAQADNAELLSDTLMELGALSASIEDANAETPDEQPIFGEPGDPPPGIWNQNVVSALLEEGSDVPALIQALEQETAVSQLRYSTEVIAEQDWVRATQSQFAPIRIRDDLWIVPTWHEAPTRMHSISCSTLVWPSALAATPPPTCAWPGWLIRYKAMSAYWITVVALAFWRLPPANSVQSA